MSEELVFAGQGVWTAAIVPTRLETTVTLIESTATIYLSDSDIDQLSLPESEGFYLSQRSPDAITYFIEKDFPCVHPRLSELIEAPSETFPAPARFEERKSSASIT